MEKLTRYRYPDPTKVTQHERPDIPHSEFYLAADVDDRNMKPRHVYISATHKKIYWLVDGKLYQHDLTMEGRLVSFPLALAANAECEALVKGNTREALHGRIVRDNLMKLEEGT